EWWRRSPLLGDARRRVRRSRSVGRRRASRPEGRRPGPSGWAAGPGRGRPPAPLSLRQPPTIPAIKESLRNARKVIRRNATHLGRGISFVAESAGGTRHVTPKKHSVASSNEPWYGPAISMADNEPEIPAKPLLEAVMAGDLTRVRGLIEAGADPTEFGEYSPLAQAAESGRADMVDVLLKAGADVNFGGIWIPLCCAV